MDVLIRSYDSNEKFCGITEVMVEDGANNADEMKALSYNNNSV